MLAFMIWLFRRTMGGGIFGGGASTGRGRGGAGGIFGFGQSTARMVDKDEIKVTFK